MHDMMAEFPKDGALHTSALSAQRAVELLMVYDDVLVSPGVDSVPAGDDMTTRFCWRVVEAASNEIRGTLNWQRKKGSNLQPWNNMMNGLATLVHSVEDRAIYTFTPSMDDWVSFPSPRLSTRSVLPTQGYFLTVPVIQHETFLVIAGLLSSIDTLEDTLFPVYAQYYDMLKSLSAEDMTAYSETSIYRDMRALFSTHLAGSFATALDALEYDDEVPFAWQAPQFFEQYRIVVQSDTFQQMFDELFAGHQRRAEMLRNGGRIIVMSARQSPTR